MTPNDFKSSREYSFPVSCETLSGPDVVYVLLDAGAPYMFPATTYVLITIPKKRMGYPEILYRILQFLSVSIFEETPIWSAFSASESQLGKGDSDIQLTLFDL